MDFLALTPLPLLRDANPNQRANERPHQLLLQAQFFDFIRNKNNGANPYFAAAEERVTKLKRIIAEPESVRNTANMIQTARVMLDEYTKRQAPLCAKILLANTTTGLRIVDDDSTKMETRQPGATGPWIIADRRVEVGTISRGSIVNYAIIEVGNRLARAIRELVDSDSVSDLLCTAPVVNLRFLLCQAFLAGSVAPTPNDWRRGFLQATKMPVHLYAVACMLESAPVVTRNALIMGLKARDTGATRRDAVAVAYSTSSFHEFPLPSQREFSEFVSIRDAASELITEIDAFGSDPFSE